MVKSSLRAAAARRDVWSKLSVWFVAALMALVLSVAGAQVQQAFADDEYAADEIAVDADTSYAVGYVDGIGFGHWMHSDGGWWFLWDDGVYAVGLTYIVDDNEHMEWYYFDDNGWMVTGWQYIEPLEGWYYFASSGSLAWDWQYIDGAWYWLDPQMLTGWQEIDGAWYLFADSGAMLTGWQSMGGSWYYLQPDGVMATGWQNIGGAWYYLQPGGAMATGWTDVDGAWYYFDGSGAMLSNQWIGDYYVGASGAMATNQWVGNYYVGADGRWISNATEESAAAVATNSSTVYWVPNGKVYHSTKSCPSLARSKTILSGSLADCPKTDPCPNCH